MIALDEVSNEEFESYVAAGIDAIPEQFARAIDNVAIVVSDNPTIQQRIKLRLRPNSLLFGLYEGVPKTARFGRSPFLPDKITIFKYPILAISHTKEEVKAQVKKTVWHEVAHHFGLNHTDIDSKEYGSK